MISSASFSVTAQSGLVSMSIAGGAGVPLPKFGVAGVPAKGGGILELSYQYKFPKSDFAITVGLSGRKNVLDPIEAEHSKGVIYTERKGTVTSRAALAGITYQKSFGNKWYLTGRVMAGIVNISFDSTYQKYTNTNPQPSGFDGISEYITGKGSGNGFTAVAAVGPGFRLSRGFDVFVNVEYWYTQSAPLETELLIEAYVNHQDPAWLTKNPSSLDLVAGIRFRF